MNAKAIKHLVEVDAVMKQLVERVGPMKLKPRRLPPFRSLVSAIIYQQLSGKAAETIFNRFVALYGGTEFPAPKAVLSTTPETMRSAGVSRQKASYILEIARHCDEGLVPGLDECDRLEDEQIIERFTQVKGVGRWTVEMFLIFNLGRLDVLPINDLGVRKGYMHCYKKRKMPEPKQLLKIGEVWRPYRTVASWYLWRSQD